MGDFDASLVVKRAKNAFNANKTKPVASRRKLLQGLLRMIEEKEQDFVDALRKDLNKHPFESLISELDFAKNEVINALNNLDEWTKPQPVEKGIHMIGIDAFIKNQPYGTALIIGAWNYPFQVTIVPLVGALAAGNTAIIKPSEISVHFAETLARVAPMYLDEDCVQIVNGGVEVTTALLNEKHDYIFYTGSSVVGKIIMQAAVKHLTPVTLELGGKSPCYIDDDVDMGIVVHRLMWAKLMNAGQTCIAPDYVICKRSLNDKLLSVMSKTIKEFYGENPQKSSDYARIISDRHFQRVLNLTKCGKIALGGETDASQRYFAPTVLVDVGEEEPAMQEEVFGPVLPIYNIDSLDNAIDFINRKPKPLTLYVMSNSKKVIKRFTDETSSGSLVANDFYLQASCDTLPFGGVGNSGMGSYHGKFSFEVFSHKRACVIAKQGMEKLLSLRYPPFTNRNLSLMRWFLSKKLKGGYFSTLFSVALIGVCAALLFMFLDGRFSQ